jgi:putative CocE/NonD family hydrolase
MKRLLSSALLFAFLASVLTAQRGPAPDPELVAKRNAIEKQLEDIAVIDRKVMVPMRDGKRMATDIYRPKDTSKKYPIIFVRTPYNFNFWDVKLGAPRDMSAELEAVKRGYIYVEMNERGHFFSEGNYDILGPPLTDGSDAITWMASQEWTTGKVGTIGCSSTAEWRGRADAVHLMAVWRAEPDQADVSAEYVSRRLDSGIERVRFSAAASASRLGESASASAGDGYLQSRRWAAWHLRGQNAGSKRRGDDSAQAERSSMV